MQYTYMSELFLFVAAWLYGRHTETDGVRALRKQLKIWYSNIAVILCEANRYYLYTVVTS